MWKEIIIISISLLFQSKQCTGRRRTTYNPNSADPIERVLDYIEPLDGRRGVNFQIIDYSAKEIVDVNKKLRGKEFCYIDMLLGSRYVEFFDLLEKDSELINKRLKGKTVIMPLFFKQQHIVILYADMKNKVVQYYDPGHPKLGFFSQFSADKRLRRFVLMLKQRNRFVKKYEKIDISGWKVTKPKIVLKKQNDSYNCGVLALKWIDCNLNGDKLKFGTIEDAPDVYRKGLLEAMKVKARKDEPKMIAQRQKSLSYWKPTLVD